MCHRPVMSTERVTESLTFSGGKVDRSGPYPRIRNVLICGLRSVHGYDYDPDGCWGNGRAKQVYEGIDSYAGHGDGGDQTALKLGWWENVTTREDGRPQGDYCLNPKHPLTESVLWAAEHRPSFYAVSHVADVRKVKGPGGRVVVESIHGRAHSVDLVDTGGTTDGLFESARKRGRPVAMTVREYGNRLGHKCTVDELFKLRWLVKEDGMGDAPMGADAPDPSADATTGGAGIDSAFQAAALKEIADCMAAKGDPAKLKRCLGRLKKLLVAHGELSADDVDEEEEETDADAGDGGKAKEGGKKGKKPAAAPAVDPWEIVAECEREQYKPDATDLKVLKLVCESADRLTYIRRQKGLVNATDPRSKSREQIAGGDQKNKDGTGTVKEGGADAQPATGVEEARQVMAQLSKDARGAK